MASKCAEQVRQTQSTMTMAYTETRKLRYHVHTDSNSVFQTIVTLLHVLCLFVYKVCQQVRCGNIIIIYTITYIYMRLDRCACMHVCMHTWMHKSSTTNHRIQFMKCACTGTYIRQKLVSRACLSTG